MGGLGTRSFRLRCTLFFLLVSVVRAGNTTCASGQLDWYSSVVGESPCVTYQRLRQICNNDYQVPSFRPNTPGDNCDDQVSACCCNTVAFQLSMLCMNCQQDQQAGDQIGIDAGVGAYQLYRATCGAGTNHSLPQDIQKAVCNLNIRLDNYLYTGGWDDGSWFYVYTKESAVRDHAVNNNNTFTHCANQISPTATPTPSSTTSSSAQSAITSSTQTSSADGSSETSGNSNTGDHTSSSSHTGPIVGGVVGGIALIAAIVGLLLWRKRRARRFGGITRGIQEAHHNYDIDGNDSANGLQHMISPFSGMVTHGTQPSAPTTSQMMSPEGHVPPSSWSDITGTGLQTSPTGGSLRHKDAGVVIPLPLSRSGSGRLPPAYRSWENDSSVGSDVRSSHPGSATSPTGSAPASEVAADPNMPLVPLRLEEKAGSSMRLLV
ncbi:hypothetical protein BC628DRAFT_592049 [Trametes gibbosa]|nr:hypothetical protein BC628DRAFT_592049 [Trametes gibbosa]